MYKCVVLLQGLYEAGRGGRQKDWMHSQFTGEQQLLPASVFCLLFGSLKGFFRPDLRQIYGLRLSHDQSKALSSHEYSLEFLGYLKNKN